MTRLPDSLLEILATLRSNKLRTALTSFAVAWGVFLLVVLLSSGQGFNHGMMHNVGEQRAELKTLTIYPGYTTLPYNGYRGDRVIHMTMFDVEDLVAHFPGEITAFAPSVIVYGINGTITSGNKTTAEKASMYGVLPAALRVKGLRLLSGRYINEADLRLQRKVMVTEKSLAESLFGSTEEAVGKQVFWNGIRLTVIGVVNDTDDRRGENSMPLTTYQTLLSNDNGQSRYVRSVTLLCENLADAKAGDRLSKEISTYLKHRFNVNPDDTGAIYIDNGLQGTEMIRKVMVGLNLLLWVIGLSTLVIGVIGVANIMQITVAERSREIGIRKAIGAKSKKIVLMIIREAVLITTLSGLIGLTAGVGLMELVSLLMTTFGIGTEKVADNTVTLFLDPVISFGAAIGMIIVMIASGVLAGYLPARRAVRISAIEAMRN